MSARHGVLACLGFVAPAMAQLFTTDAGVMSPELPTVKERIQWLVREDSEELRATTRFSFAPHRRLQLDLALPFARREVEVAGVGGVRRGTQEGLGDLELDAKWGLVRDDDVMRSDRLSVLGRLSLPTGDTDDRIDGIALGPRVALGLDTWGGSLGLGYTLVRDRHRAAIAVRAAAFAQNELFDSGEEVTLDVAWWVRLTPREFDPEQASVEVRGVLEVLGRWKQDDELVDVDLQNGGTEWSFVVGAQMNLDPATSFEAGLTVPLDTSIESPFGDPRYGLLFSFRLSF